MTNDYRLKMGSGYAVISIRMIQAMLMKNQLDSAAYFLALAKTDSSGKTPELQTLILQTEAELKIQSGAFAEAESLLQQCQQLITKNKLQVNAAAGILAPDYLFAQLRIKQNRLQEAIDFLKLDIKRLLNNRVLILRDYRLIAELYAKMGNGAKAAEAYAIFLSKNDSLLADQEKFRSISFEAEQQMNEKELSIANLESQNRISSLSRNFLIGIAALLLLVAVGIYQRFRFKKKANLVLENTLSKLKSTQTQLIQSEKLASLGELTAGIAHEIQNPLNFVNNFSEVSAELVTEMNEELDKGDVDEAKEIANDLKQNLEKINLHGKRASSIVKGMLEHSRTSTGVKEPTDFNALADEYLRLAYHGLRAKDNSCNSDFELIEDENLPKIEVIPQDMGRVLLNLINNAFWAVNERSKKGETGYEPKVSVKTSSLSSGEGRGEVCVEIIDNGTGMTEDVKAKIFQPFFTTKPTGQGTGLGLSLAYDIITKGHGGTLEVESKEGEGTTFIVKLPIKTI